jgi:hypothetical protein
VTASITIEDNVPIPRKRGSRTGQYRYPFRQMLPGQSFFVPDGNPGTLQHGAKRATREQGWTFTTRSVVENGVPGVRCWRVA